MNDQYQVLPDDIGVQGTPIRLTLNVAQYHIKQTEDEKDLILGNAIVTGRYASTICMLIDVEPKAGDPDSFEVTVTDGTDEFTCSNIKKSQFSPGVWARLCGYSNVKASNNKPYNRDKYRTSTYYPIIVKIVSVLSNDVGGDDLDSDLHSCTLFDVTTSAGNQPKPESEEWYNIVYKHNIEKSIAFYEEYCLTPQQKLSLDSTLPNNNNNHNMNNNNNNNSMLQLPVPAYHRILDNPCSPIPMTCTNMWLDTKPIQEEQQDEPKLLYYGKDVTNRIVHLTLYVEDNTDPCPDDPQCSADCKHVDFSDNSTDGITSHLSKYPPKDSTCYDLSRIGINTTDGEHSTDVQTVGFFTIGNEGYKNQQLLDEHENKAKKAIQEIVTIDKQTKEYCDLLKEEYNNHLEQVKHFHMIITSRLSTHPLFATLIEPLQKQLEDTIKTSQQQQFDTIEELNDVLDWNNTTSDLLMNCKQIIDTLLNTNIALYNDFYEYYLPHLDEQLQSLQQQMQFISSSNNNNIDTTYPIPQSSSTATSLTASQTSPSTTSPITSTLFNYQRNVIRPIAHYRYNRGHVAPYDYQLLDGTILSPAALLHISESDEEAEQEEDQDEELTVSSIQSHTQQHALQLSLARQRMLINAVDYEHALLDIKDDEISELKKQIKTLQETTQLLTSSPSIHIGARQFIDSQPQQQLQLQQQHDNTDHHTSNNNPNNNNNSRHHPSSLLHDITIYKQQLAVKDKQLEQQHQHYTSQLESKDKQIEMLLKMLADKS